MSPTRRGTTVAVVAVVALVAARSAFAQAAQADHWKYVPPLATTCFSNDDFLDRLHAASAAIGAEIEKQNAINAAAKEKFDNMDMAEKAQRMQAFMMKNPQAAAKMMQAEQAAGAAATSAVTGGNESVARLTTELERLEASFRAALEQAVKPVQARREALIKARTVLVGEVQEPAFANAADHAQYVQLIEEENAAIAKACIPHFGANGTFHKWLASYRTEVTERVITAGADATDIVVMQMVAMDLPGGGYRSTNPLQQVSNHLAKIGEVYGKRPGKVVPTIGIRGR